MNDEMNVNAIFEQEGTPLDAGGNTPISLDDQATIWLVTSGYVDVFAGQVDDGHAQGARHYLFSVGTGAVLLGMPSDETGMGFLGVGRAGTCLQSLPFSL